MRIFNQAFDKKANTLDILLFRGFHTNAKLQRLFTQSQYGKSDTKLFLSKFVLF